MQGEIFSEKVENQGKHDIINMFEDFYARSLPEERKNII